MCGAQCRHSLLWPSVSALKGKGVLRATRWPSGNSWVWDALKWNVLCAIPNFTGSVTQLVQSTPSCACIDFIALRVFLILFLVIATHVLFEPQVLCSVAIFAWHYWRTNPWRWAIIRGGISTSELKKIFGAHKSQSCLIRHDKIWHPNQLRSLDPFLAELSLCWSVSLVPENSIMLTSSKQPPFIA